MPSFHSDLGPSGADIFLNCVGAPNAQRGLPDDAGIEAAQGTIFHEYAEMALKFGLEPYHFTVGTRHQIEGFEIVYDDEMAHHMQWGLDYIRQIMLEHPDAMLFVEQWVEIPALGKDATGRQRGGTSDVCIIIPSLRKIICFDWKYGGVPVYPVENNQARLYVLGCWQEFAGAIFDWDPHGIEVLIHIEQPRAPGGGGEWPTTMVDVLKFADDVALKVKASEDPDAPRTPGSKQCRYCRARKTCGAKAKWEFDMLGQKFADADVLLETYELTGAIPRPTMPNPVDLTPLQRSFILLNKSSFISWIDSLHEAAMEDAKYGREVPLMKVVPGRSGARKFRENFMAEVLASLRTELGKKFEEKAFTKPELRSPAQIEEEIGRAKFKKLFNFEDADDPSKSRLFISQDPPGLSLVPVTHKSDAIKPVAEAFNDDDV